MGAGPGSINAYACNVCGGFTVTIHRDAGVTPSMLACRALGSLDACTGTGFSMFYRADPSKLPTPHWEWYRPDKKELRGYGRETREHVRQGGLLLRPLPEATT